MTDPIICLEHVNYTYPFAAEPALRDISLTVQKGEILLVTGPSGCGKSTLLKVLNGLIPNHFKGILSGRVAIEGAVGTVLQNPDEQILATTVEEEIALALEWRSVPQSEIRARVDLVMEMFGLSSLARRSVFTLSSGERQKCVIASVVAAGDEIVVLDEPTANLSPEATEELGEICRTLKRQGKTVVIVDHRLYWVRGLLDRLLVLRAGALAVELDASSGVDVLDELEKHTDFETLGLRATRVARANLEEVPCEMHDGASTSARELTFRFKRGAPMLYDHFSFALPKGVVCAVTGPNGAGKTTLARLLCGLLKPQSGVVTDEGGLALSPRHRRLRAAFAMQQMDIQLYMRTVEDELRFSALRNRGKNEVAADVEYWLERLGLAALRTRHPQSLSGGEKQRLVIACAFMKRPALLVLDEPTSGLDGRNMRLIAEELRDYAARGGTALVITHDLELLQRVATCELNLNYVAKSGRESICDGNTVPAAPSPRGAVDTNTQLPCLAARAPRVQYAL